MSATNPDRPLIAIIDGDDSLRAELRVLFGAAAFAVQVFNSAEDYFLKRNESHSPHCIVLDTRLPGMSGLDLQYQLANIGHKTPFVFLTADNEVRTSVQAMKAGAIDYLIKPFQREELLVAVNRGIEFDRAQRLQKRTFDELLTRLASLSPRERETMVLLSAGQGPKQVAAKLSVCTHTARVHSSRVMYKMGARSIADLVRMVDRLVTGSHVPCYGADSLARNQFGCTRPPSRNRWLGAIRCLAAAARVEKNTIESHNS
jgi:FixJ family two-component response regulator